MSEPKSVDVKPQIKAWLAFEQEANDGGLLNPATIGAPEIKYLRNRLWRAFNAGWDAAWNQRTSSAAGRNDEWDRLMTAYKGAVILYYAPGATSDAIAEAGDAMNAARKALDAFVLGAPAAESITEEKIRSGVRLDHLVMNLITLGFVHGRKHHSGVVIIPIEIKRWAEELVLNFVLGKD